MSSVTVMRPAVQLMHRLSLCSVACRLLLVPAEHFAGGLHQRVEGVGVQRLGVLLVAAHGPGADQRRFGFARRLIISTAQPSSSLFLITRAVQPLSRHRRGSWMGSAFGQRGLALPAAPACALRCCRRPPACRRTRAGPGRCGARGRWPAARRPGSTTGRVDHGVGRRQVQAHAAGLQADQEHRHLPGLEPRHHRAARVVGVSPVSIRQGSPAPQLHLHQGEHLGELREHQHAAALGHQARAACRPARSAWRAPCHRPGDRRAFSRRGSQQTWRSFSSASRMRSGAPRTSALEHPAHALVGGRAHALVQRRAGRLPVAGGAVARSAAAARWPRGLAPAQDEGPHAAASNCAPQRSRRASRSACANVRRKLRASPRKPGIRKWNCAHSSPRWFSSGVPVRHSRWRASVRRTFSAAAAAGVLDCLRLVEDQQVELLRASASRRATAAGRW
jgi:hypothetical protein